MPNSSHTNIEPDAPLILIDPKTIEPLKQEEQQNFTYDSSGEFKYLSSEVIFDENKSEWLYKQYEPIFSDEEAQDSSWEHSPPIKPLSIEPFNENGEVSGVAQYFISDYENGRHETSSVSWANGVKNGLSVSAVTEYNSLGSYEYRREEMFVDGLKNGSSAFFEKINPIKNVFESGYLEASKSAKFVKTAESIYENGIKVSDVTIKLDTLQPNNKDSVISQIDTVKTSQNESIVELLTEKFAELKEGLYSQAKHNIEQRADDNAPEERMKNNVTLFSKLSKSLGLKMHEALDTAVLNVYSKQAKPDVIIGYQESPSVQKSFDKEFSRPLTVENHRMKIKDGDLHYMRGKETAFVDRGERVDVNTERHALAALKYSQQKWGAVEIKGTPEFIEACIKIAAVHNIEIMNPELQDRLQNARNNIKSNEIKPAHETVREHDAPKFAQPLQEKPEHDIRFERGDLKPVELTGNQHDALMAELNDLNVNQFTSSIEQHVDHGYNLQDLDREYELGGNIPFMDYHHLFDEHDFNNQRALDHEIERERNDDYEPKYELTR